MKTYNVTIRVKGVKRLFREMIVHATNKTAAEHVAATAFAQDEPREYYKCGGNYVYEAHVIA